MSQPSLHPLAREAGGYNARSGDSAGGDVVMRMQTYGRAFTTRRDLRAQHVRAKEAQSSGESISGEGETEPLNWIRRRRSP
jgi:hypothetical protein